MGISDVPLDSSESGHDIWLQRRAAFHGGSLLMGRGVSTKCKNKLECQDDFASTPTPRDPLHRPGNTQIMPAHYVTISDLY